MNEEREAVNKEGETKVENQHQRLAFAFIKLAFFSGALAFFSLYFPFNEFLLHSLTKNLRIEAVKRK
jgi:hypothetical protein